MKPVKQELSSILPWPYCTDWLLYIRQFFLHRRKSSETRHIFRLFSNLYITLDLLFLPLLLRAQRWSLAISSLSSEERAEKQVLSTRLADSKEEWFEWHMVILLCLLYFVIASSYNFSNLFVPWVCGFAAANNESFHCPTSTKQGFC